MGRFNFLCWLYGQFGVTALLNSCLSLGAINKNLWYQAHIIHKTVVFSENEKSSSRFQGEEETAEHEFIHSFLVRKSAVFVIQIIVNHKSETQEISAVSMELLVYLYWRLKGPFCNMIWNISLWDMRYLLMVKLPLSKW